MIQIHILDSLLAHVGKPHADFMPPPAGFSHDAGIFGICLSGGVFALIETVMLLVLECFPKLLSDFAARKICHSCSGLLFLTLDSTSAAGRGAMYLIGISSILMTWELTSLVGIKPFRFGSTKDVGMTIYLVLVLLWFFGELPPAALAPMFFADPAGAVVGKWMTRNYSKYNKAWYEKKTVAGSLAVFTFTLLTLKVFYPPMVFWHMLLLSLVAPLAEAVGGSFDNLLLSAVVIGGYYLLEGAGTKVGWSMQLLERTSMQNCYAYSAAIVLGLGVVSCLAALRHRSTLDNASEEGSPALYLQLVG